MGPAPWLKNAVQNQTELNHLLSNQTHILHPMPPAALLSTQEDLKANPKGFIAIVLCGCWGPSPPQKHQGRSSGTRQNQEPASEMDP